MLNLLCMCGLALAANDWTSSEVQERSLAWDLEHPESLPHWMTPEEQNRLDDIGRTFTETDPPQAVPRSIAEFERMAAVMIRYPFGIPYSLIRDLSENHPLLTIVSSSSQENSVRNIYTNQNINLDNCTFLHAPSNSYWCRDYGPWFIQTGDEVAVMDFPYNRPRPSDDDIPVQLAAEWNLSLFGMDLIHTGGNWMSNGYGVAASSDLVLEENPGLSQTQVNQLVEDYLGIDSYHALPDPNNTYIDHIDCWGKFLDVDKVLVREVPMSHAQYDEIEAVADYFAQAESGWNRPFQVFRVWTPNDQPYTNALIVNGHVYVPIMNSSWDDEALAVYEDALPGYQVEGYLYSGNWFSTDALHCRTKGMADPGLLHIHHVPLPDTLEAGGGQTLQLNIRASSGQSLLADSLAMRYRINGGDWARIPMQALSGDRFQVSLPTLSAGQHFDYILQAADASGRFEQHPFAGVADPHQFSVSGLGSPLLQIQVTQGQLQLYWESVPGAGNYRILHAESLDGPFETVAEIAETSWSSPLDGTQGFFRLQALSQ